ncbi:hypothetical protein BO94DRAFT_540458 [Aspergillus sclerotioniger CBS 115572]|uniref:Uncharacterized protein n=1 Tax=Aspergillus sclerotioniger CBS 115572 TaxID=1450535 RepID=A0A317UYU4_9EURO|nr:hypothetical protein BO94DRAFT_540458 [Aspergillus sclerotioniger CBS 115572]PWY67243.1 hypothetical protein BO94DRAFT_540458 [Aspergillus sclerotioniger CBS 115572]
MSDLPVHDNEASSPRETLAGHPGGSLASQTATSQVRLSASSGLSHASTHSAIDCDASDTAPDHHGLGINLPADERSHFSDDTNDTDEMEEYEVVSGASSPSSISFQLVEHEREKLYPIAVTMFVGNPRPQADRPVHLSCIVLSSQWRQDFFPGSCRNKADKAAKCKDIVRYNEQYLSQIAKYSCAVCTEPTAARKFVHQPIMFTRTSKSGLEDGPRRRLIMRLGQLVHCRWKFPDMNATLGGAAEAQVFEVAVPVCGKTSCGVTARTSAHQLVNSLIPTIAELDVATLDLEMVIPTTEIGTTGTSGGEWTPDGAEVLVRKLGPDCVPLEG